MRDAAELGLSEDGADLSLLQQPTALALIKQMLKLEEIVELAATKYEPHHLAHYSLELGRTFSAFYDACRILPPKETDSASPYDPAVGKALLALSRASKQVLARTLDLMGVSAPESM